MSEGRLSPADIEAILGALPAARLGVVGDFCLDFYQLVELSASEISVETGLATLPVHEVRYSLGGAGNVVNNLTAMGARSVKCYGVVGDDPHGRVLLDLLKRAGGAVDGMLVQNEGWLTQTYSKVMVEGKERPRIDWGNFNSLAAQTEASLVERLEQAAEGLDLLLINQQLVHGIHSGTVRQALARICSRAAAPVCIVDSRDYSEEFTGAIRKLNDHEGARLCLPDRESEGPIDLEAARKIAATLFERWHVPLLLTRGERGCLVYDEAGSFEVPGLAVGSRIDPVGAGDSMLAGTAAALAAGSGLRQGAQLGNLVAGVTVQKRGQTGTASPEEITGLARRAAYRFRPELAAALHEARYHPGTRIEIATDLPHGRRFSYAIFDNDGTLSTLREGWEEVMEPVMVRSIFGGAPQGHDEKSCRMVLERVREYIDRTTGVQTLVQMHGLAEMVREFAFVPPEAVLTPEGYKERYNTELMSRVEERIRRLESGELRPEDFLIKGSLEFVSRLVERGISVYLASGTDHSDVLREAQALGYASLFGDAIYGSVGDIEHDPKERVIRTILAEIERDRGGEPSGGKRAGAREAEESDGKPPDASGHAATIITFGDGPVEIRETGRYGGYSVGVASNELRRFELNPAKRRRLIEAGADLVIPDFSERHQLCELLFPESSPTGGS